MTIYLYSSDNAMAYDKIECNKIEFTMDGNLILDEYRVVNISDVHCIVSN